MINQKIRIHIIIIKELTSFFALLQTIVAPNIPKKTTTKHTNTYVITHEYGFIFFVNFVIVLLCLFINKKKKEVNHKTTSKVFYDFVFS